MKVLTIILFGFILLQTISKVSGLLNSSQMFGFVRWLSDAMGPVLLHSATIHNKFNPIEHVYFSLYTKNNAKIPQVICMNDIKSIKASNFNAQNPTKIIIHGWMSDSKQAINTLIRDAYLSIGPHNIIVIDWETKSNAPYSIAVKSVPDVGRKVAALIDFMAKYGFINPKNLTLVGHSLGAHISGNVGRMLKTGRIHTIIALDPAAILFPYDTSEHRLRSTDAYYVESIQTNGELTGFVEPIGKATFYPNGGQIQPGCDVDPLDVGCSHSRSYELFAEAIRINGFPSIKCENYKKAIENKCGNKFSQKVRMGASGNADVASGVFYVPTRARSPFAIKLY